MSKMHRHSDLSKVTHVWLETDPMFPILDKDLPVTIEAGREWETNVRDNALSLPDGTDITDLVRVRLSGDIVLTGTPRVNVPPAGG